MAEVIPQNSREVAKGSFWSLAGSVFFKLSSFLYVILLARAASQDDIGTFYLALSAMSIIWVFSDFGISGAFTRYVPFFEGAGERGKIRDLLRLSLRYLALFSFALMAILIWQADNLGAFYGNPALPEAIRILSLYVLLGNLFRLNYLYLQGTADIKGSQLFQNLQNFLKLVITAALFFLYGASVLTISLGFVLSFLFALIASIFPVFRSISAITEAGGLGRQEIIREIMPLGLTIAVVSYFSTIIASSDRLIIGFVLEPSSSSSLIAVYSMAATLASVLMVFPGSIGNIFLPVVSRLVGKKDLAGMREVLATAQRWSLFITLPIAAVMMAFAGDMLLVFYGPEYSSGTMVMALFTFGLVFAAFSYMASLALTAMRLVKIELYIAIASGVTNIVLNFILIPVFGIEGAAAASAISFAQSAFMLSHFAKTKLGYRNPPETYRLLAAALMVFIAAMAAKPLSSAAAASIIAQAGAGEFMPKAIYLAFLGTLITISGALFVAFSLALKCFQAEDVALMRRVLEKAGVPAPITALAQKMASYGVHPEKL
ncbi:flippase [Candidatus Micrarchaeota archaeon]|nr:flippase [Candidatus Micrarchaeota archaeon]